MKSLLVLGSTGSIGTQTLELVRADPDGLRVSALGARRSWERLLQQVREFRPAVVGLADRAAAERLRPLLPAEVALVTGPEAMEELAARAEFDTAVHGLVGAAGVRPSQRVLERGKTLALANKESLVVAGEPLMELARRHGATLIPIDSEHSAIFQCLRGEDPGRVRRIHLTASGGPFRDLPFDEFAGVTPERALEHPNWDMGPRISVGSATLMNKALEVIETRHLFGIEPDRIHVVIHRQSVVHSMVEFVDGSILAQLGPPDMRVPIHFALHYPARRPSNLRGFEPDLFSSLTFEEPDPARFPALELGFRCAAAGGAAGSALNAADEVAVAGFLAGEIKFQEIAEINRRVLDRFLDPARAHREGPAREGFGSRAAMRPLTVEERVDRLLGADADARQLARAELDAASAATARS